MKKLIYAASLWVAILILATVFPNNLQAQSAKEIRKKEQAARIRTAVADSQHFVFRPQAAIPASGGMRNLSYGYELIVSLQKIDSYLPFFGIAYTAEYGSTKSPLEFISEKFTYTLATRKKGGWDIIINTKDTKDPKRLILNIFENGAASLQVSSNDRQPISFNGFVEPFKKDENK